MQPTPRQRRRIDDHIRDLTGPDEERSFRAEWYLMLYYGAKVIDQLIPVSRHRKSIVRCRVAMILGRTKDPRAYETVLRLTNDRHPDVRYDASIALGILGDIRAIEPLSKIVREHEDGVTCDAAAEGLGRLGTPAIPELLKILDLEDSVCQQLAAFSLGELQAEEAIEPLSRLLRSDSVESRLTAINGLGRMNIDRAKRLVEAALIDSRRAVKDEAEYWLENLDSYLAWKEAEAARRGW